MQSFLITRPCFLQSTSTGCLLGAGCWPLALELRAGDGDDKQTQERCQSLKEAVDTVCGGSRWPAWIRNSLMLHCDLKGTPSTCSTVSWPLNPPAVLPELGSRSGS